MLYSCIVTYDRSVSFFGFDLTDIMTEILLKVTLNTNKTDHHDITDIVESDIKNP